MKGQYRLVSEILLFVLGILIASFSAFTLSSTETDITEASIEDQMGAISDFLTLAIVKVFEIGENSSIMLKMPRYFSSRVYKIRGYQGTLVVSLYEDERINVTHEIFNISESKNIIGMITSSSEYVMITNNMTTIEIRSGNVTW